MTKKILSQTVTAEIEDDGSAWLKKSYLQQEMTLSKEEITLLYEASQKESIK